MQLKEFAQLAELNALKKVLACEETKKKISEHFYARRASQTISGTL
jgi:hypothetical protein